MPLELSLKNKVALVSGGSRGIGAATVELLVKSGAKVAFNYHQAAVRADKVVESCGRDHAAAFQQELSTAEDARALVEATVKRFGRLDILVANHGIWPPKDAPIDRMSDEQWLHTMAVNLNSVFGLVKHAVAQMKQQGAGGAIVLISSTAGQRGEAFHCDYAATKGAVISMTKGLATELARDKIRVNCVAPGWVATDMAAPALEDPTVAPRVFATIPLGRVGTPEELAACIVFLCTEGAGFVTGEVFNVNGGAVLVG
ncbi:MAG: glucose 1-dehydrogenase [Candidatus Koribacter versatilis]|uniref:Glucose 1-dehydrogenase n=1 Tax=Candidatus Korobacter versatilis TaxID=658062 RepID=A0A932A7I0_9BACT|nr:glucose 1-dehydrogenase [Candidatus Koribacter versatilis]